MSLRSGWWCGLADLAHGQCCDNIPSETDLAYSGQGCATAHLGTEVKCCVVAWLTWLLGSAQQQHFLVLQSPKAEGVQQSVGQGWFLDCKMCVINVLRSGWWWCDLADLASG